MRCLIVDDEPLAIKVLEKHLEFAPDLKPAGAFTNPLEALEFLRKEEVDLLFLDINMPDLDGISFFRTLQPSPLVIFTTAYPEYAVEGFDLQAVDYLLKPIRLDRFLKAVNRAMDLYHKNLTGNHGQEVLVIRADRKAHRVHFADIHFVQAFGDYVKIKLPKGWLVPKMTLNELEKQLPESRFLRVHRTYLVNVDKVEYMEGNQLALGEDLIPVSKGYREAVQRRLGME